MRLTAVALALLLGSFTGLPAEAANGKTELLWLGQAAFRISTPGGKTIVIDPWIMGNPKTPAEWKDLAKLDKVEVILVTHDHGDHLGDAVHMAMLNNVLMRGTAVLANPPHLHLTATP